MNSKLNVQAIFDSIDGEVNGFEGAGQLTTFIRLKGCNLRCQYCDTKYAQDSEPENLMKVEDILQRVHFEKVTITGGEPLLAGDNLISLVRCLLDKGSKITIETNGSVALPKEFYSAFLHRLRFVVDYKTPSSNMDGMMNDQIFQSLRATDVIKFVISDEEDYWFAKEMISSHPSWVARKVFSPVMGITWGKYTACSSGAPRKSDPRVDMTWPQQLAEMMIRDKVDAQFGLQIHKVLWPDACEER